MRKNKNKYNNKKAQAEIMGMLIFVIMLLLFGAIYLTLSLKRAPVDRKIDNKEYKSELYEHTLDVILNTNMCNKFSLKEVILDCGTSSNKISCNGKDSCEAATTFLNTTLSKILKKEEFQFLVVKGDIEVINVTSENCNLSYKSVGSINVLPLWPAPGNLIITLYSC